MQDVVKRTNKIHKLLMPDKNSNKQHKRAFYELYDAMRILNEALSQSAIQLKSFSKEVDEVSQQELPLMEPPTRETLSKQQSNRTVTLNGGDPSKYSVSLQVDLNKENQNPIFHSGFSIPQSLQNTNDLRVSQDTKQHSHEIQKLKMENSKVVSENQDLVL